MIFRAVFWIGLVSLLTPHEPDLGLGRPGAGTSQITPAALLSSVSGLSRTGTTCGSACAGGLFSQSPGLPTFQINASVGNGLADVKAQIEADKRERAARNSSI